MIIFLYAQGEKKYERNHLFRTIGCREPNLLRDKYAKMCALKKIIIITNIISI